jgi:transposase
MSGRAYSVDLRERVLADLDEGMSKAAISRTFRVSTRWIYKLQRQREETGDIAPRRGQGGPRPKLAGHVDRLLELVDQQPDASLRELRDRLGAAVCIATVHNALRALGVTFKKGGARR